MSKSTKVPALAYNALRAILWGFRDISDLHRFCRQKSCLARLPVRLLSCPIILVAGWYGLLFPNRPNVSCQQSAGLGLLLSIHISIIAEVSSFIPPPNMLEMNSMVWELVSLWINKELQQILPILTCVNLCLLLYKSLCIYEFIEFICPIKLFHNLSYFSKFTDDRAVVPVITKKR